MKVIAKITDCFANNNEPDIKITLYQGLPKADKMEIVIQKCIEIGIDRIVPIKTERAIVKFEGKEEKNAKRWNKISESAAKQSRRGKIPIVDSIISFEDAIEGGCWS